MMARAESFIIGLSFGFLNVCVLGWLIFLRRRFWQRRYPEGGRWMTAVKVLLWIALLIVPVVAGGYLMVTRQAAQADGMARFHHFFEFLAITSISLYVAFGLAMMALLIQLWRNQWHVMLTAVTTAYFLLLLMAYLWADS